MYVLLTKFKWQSSLSYLEDCYVFRNARHTYWPWLTNSYFITQHQRDATPEEMRDFHLPQSSSRLCHSPLTPWSIDRDDWHHSGTSTPHIPDRDSVFHGFGWRLLPLCAMPFPRSFSLTKRLRKDQMLTFDKLAYDKIGALESLKAGLLKPRGLALPCTQGDNTVGPDAWAKHTACVLMQNKPNSKYRPVGFWWRSANDAKCTLDPARRGCFACVWALSWLHSNLEGFIFTVRIDHDNQKWILNLTDSTGRLARWRLGLSEL